MEEMERCWNIVDLLDMNEVLDVREDCEIIARERAGK